MPEITDRVPQKAEFKFYGVGTMVDFKYVDGASVLPPDTEVRKLRPASAD